MDFVSYAVDTHWIDEVFIEMAVRGEDVFTKEVEFLLVDRVQVERKNFLGKEFAFWVEENSIYRGIPHQRENPFLWEIKTDIVTLDEKYS